jgi:hypothetical protein
MHKGGGQMQLTLTYGLMPSEQQMIVEKIIHQQMRMMPVPYQDFVQPEVHQQSRTSTNLDVQLMS